jgi:putative FmdB family regulatory protein
MLYQYVCNDCLKWFEIQIKLADYEKITEETGPKCPNCDKSLKRVITPTYFRIH